jgi:outer membrane protein assembly factor BamB
MFHKNPCHTGFAPLSNPLSPTIVWTAALSDTVEYSSPVVTSTGRIYLGDVGKELWAFNLAGHARWNYHTQGNLRYGTPAVDEAGVIYFGSADGSVYALNPDSTLKWSTPTGGAVKTAPAIAEDGTIYIGSDDGHLYALHPFDGSVIWAYPAGDTIRSSPAVGPDGTIYFGCNDGVFRAVYPSGTLRWDGATGGPIKGSPAIFRGRVVIGSGDGFVYQIDRRTGDVEWAAYTGNNIRSSPAIGVTGKVYVGVGNNITCFHDDEGDVCFEYPTGNRVFSSPAVTAGPDSTDIVLCGSDDGFLYAIKDGSLEWRAFVGSPIRSSPAIGGAGFVYVGALNGRLYAFGNLTPGSVDPTGSVAPLRLVVGPNPTFRGQSVAIRLLGTHSTENGVPEGSNGLLSIVDVTGRRVHRAALISGGVTVWDGRDAAGRVVPTGIYWTRWTDGLRMAAGRLVRLQ